MNTELKSGCWRYEEEKMHLAFYPHADPKKEGIAVYAINLDRLTNSAQLLDFILQMQRKGRWSERGEEARNFHGKWKCDDYQIWDFIEVIDLLCKHYMKTSIQGVYCAWGKDHAVDWDKLKSELKE